MTFGVPVTLVDMRAALRERTQLDANDPLATNAILNTLLNEAMRRFQISNPHGWPWDYSEQTFALTPGNGTKLEGTNASASAWMKLRYVILQEPTGLWEYPLERMARADQLQQFPLDTETGCPRTVALMGSSLNTSPQMCLFFRPVPDVAYNVVVGAQAPGPELVNDSDPDPLVNDHMLGEYSDTVIDYAAFLVWRARDDLADAMLSSKAAFDEAVISLRRTARLRVGPGRGINPLVDDRELQ